MNIISGQVRKTFALLEGIKFMPFEVNNGIWLGAQKEQGLKQTSRDIGMQRIQVSRVQCGQKEGCLPA